MLLMLSMGCAGLGARGERSAVKKQRQIRSVHPRSGALVIRLPVRLPRNVQNFGHTSCDNMDTGGSITLVGCRRLVKCGEANVDCAEVLLAVLARVFVSGCQEIWRGVLVRVLKVVLRGFVQERTTAGIERSVTSVRTRIKRVSGGVVVKTAPVLVLVVESGEIEHKDGDRHGWEMGAAVV